MNSFLYNFFTNKNVYVYYKVLEVDICASRYIDYIVLFETVNKRPRAPSYL